MKSSLSAFSLFGLGLERGAGSSPINLACQRLCENYLRRAPDPSPGSGLLRHLSGASRDPRVRRGSTRSGFLVASESRPPPERTQLPFRSRSLQPSAPGGTAGRLSASVARGAGCRPAGVPHARGTLWVPCTHRRLELSAVEAALRPPLEPLAAPPGRPRREPAAPGCGRCSVLRGSGARIAPTRIKRSSWARHGSGDLDGVEQRSA